MKPKSILIVSDFAYPVKAGTERLVFGIAKWLNEQGIKTDILTPNWNNLSEKETAEGVTIYRFKTHDINTPNATKRIFDYIKTGLKLPKYDIYHGFFMLTPLISAVLLSKLKRSKSVITFFWRDTLEKNLGGIKKPIALKIINSANFITTYTWKLEEHFKGLGYFKNTNVTTTQGWGDTEFKKGIDRERPNKKVILFVGRLSEEKGVYVLLEAFAKIKDKTDAKIVFVGPPYEKEMVERKAEELGILDRIDIVGFVSEEELSYWYENCEFTAVPAIHVDGFGLSLMETMMRGKPVVCTEGVGTPDGTEEMVIVKPGDSDELAYYMEKMLNDENFYKKCVENVRIRSKLFIKEDVMNKYLDIYNKIVK